MEGKPDKRIDFVDLTKGVCIILVVMTHIGGAFDTLDKDSMLSCFRMPLYFLYRESFSSLMRVYRDSSSEKLTS